MSEPTNEGGTSARADWSQVFTSLEWVEGWMADHGFTDAEIAYVVGREDNADAESSQQIPA